MRALVVTNLFPPHHYGGYELNCQEFVDALRARGDDVVVLTSDHRVRGVSERSDASVRRVLRLQWDGRMVRPSVPEALRIERHNQAALRTALDDLRPDVVSAWHFGALSLGLLTTCHRAGLPVVHVVNDDWLVYGPVVDRWTAGWRRSLPNAVRAAAERVLGVPCAGAPLGPEGSFVVISRATRAAAEGASVHFADVVVGGCGINTDQFPIGGAPAKATWTWQLLHVGRVDERKAIDVVIRALAGLPRDAVLDVVGRGDDGVLDDLRRLAADLGVGDRVRFDVATRRELAARYAAADVVVFTPRWGEPFGLVPLEAMACATPVIATATGGAAEYLEHEGNCLVVPVDDHGAVAASVRRLADDEGLRGRLVEGGLATAARFTLDRWLDLLLDRHDRAVSQQGP